MNRSPFACPSGQWLGSYGSVGSSTLSSRPHPRVLSDLFMDSFQQIIARYKLPNHLDRDITEELVLPGFLSPGDPVFFSLWAYFCMRTF